MKPNRSRRKEPVTVRRSRQTSHINTLRWGTYATAGAASALTCISSADANIVYSGVINQSFNASPGNFDLMRFQIGDVASLVFLHGRFPSPSSGSGKGRGGIVGFSGAGIAGFQASATGITNNYASKLKFGQNVSSRPFVAGVGEGGGFNGTGHGYLASGLGKPNSQWTNPGTGFLGFRFTSVSGGFQYGWARIDMDGAPGNSFTLIDYAFADPGERLRAGQTTESVPESGGSLGLLALGCAGLLAWRAARKGTEAQAE